MGACWTALGQCQELTSVGPHGGRLVSCLSVFWPPEFCCCASSAEGPLFANEAPAILQSLYAPSFLSTLNMLLLAGPRAPPRHIPPVITASQHPAMSPV